jgi:translation initiation factor IF-2
MIDRDTLLERVPGRRLGGDSRSQGPGAPRYGQVTELKVVNDPFGRGREMVTVGRDKRKGPGGAVPGGKPGAGGPGMRGKGRPGGRRDMNDMRERSMYPSRLKKKKTNKRTAKKTEMTQPKASKRVIKMKETIVVADLAHQLGVKSVDIIRRLMAMGTMVTQNQSIDFDTATLMAGEFSYTVDSVAFEETSVIEAPTAKDDENLQTRPPVVTVMGHVDHGKTSLLDAIRKKRVAAGEAGGITQHIGAYSVPVGNRGTVTFLDTPGHAAFTSMRARGAKVTDIVVLVVAADDGVMPQTEEAIQHAKAAGVPIVVAVNKIDRPDSNPDRVMQELTKFELLPEAWGGDTIYVNTSATVGTGIPELLDAILLQAEVLELKANPKRTAMGLVVEAQLDKGRGPVATILVKDGTLRRGDAVVVGTCSGKVRAMMDDTGAQRQEAGPSAAIEITGLDTVPQAGDVLNVVENAEVARDVAAHRTDSKRATEQSGSAAMSLDDLMKRIEGAATLELRIVLKADVQGSVEAVRASLLKLGTDEVKVNIIYGGVGGIKESDIMLAAASRGLVLGFGVRPDSKARAVAEREGVDIRTYNIIYEALDDIRRAMEGLLAPESREKIVGRAEIRDLFKVSKVGTIGGCRITEGKAIRAARVRVLRDSVQVYEGRVASLRHFKNDVREVENGQECGVGVEGYNDLKLGDIVEFFQVEEVARTLSQPAAGSRRAAPSSEARV